MDSLSLNSLNNLLNCFKTFSVKKVSLLFFKKETYSKFKICKGSKTWGNSKVWKKVLKLKFSDGGIFRSRDERNGDDQRDPGSSIDDRTQEKPSLLTGKISIEVPLFIRLKCFPMKCRILNIYFGQLKYCISLDGWIVAFWNICSIEMLLFG